MLPLSVSVIHFETYDIVAYSDIHGYNYLHSHIPPFEYLYWYTSVLDLCICVILYILDHLYPYNSVLDHLNSYISPLTK
jgi:hypothetical protein